MTEPLGRESASLLLSCILDKHSLTVPFFSSVVCFFSPLFFLMSVLNSSRWLFHTANRIHPRGQIATWSGVKRGNLGEHFGTNFQILTATVRSVVGTSAECTHMLLYVVSTSLSFHNAKPFNKLLL